MYWLDVIKTLKSNLQIAIDTLVSRLDVLSRKYIRIKKNFCTNKSLRYQRKIYQNIEVCTYIEELHELEFQGGKSFNA